MADGLLRICLDILGGIGFGPDGTDVFMEGLYIPHLKLAEKGSGGGNRRVESVSCM